MRQLFAPEWQWIGEVIVWLTIIAFFGALFYGAYSQTLTREEIEQELEEYVKERLKQRSENNDGRE